MHCGSGSDKHNCSHCHTVIHVAEESLNRTNRKMSIAVCCTVTPYLPCLLKITVMPWVIRCPPHCAAWRPLSVGPLDDVTLRSFHLSTGGCEVQAFGSSITLLRLPLFAVGNVWLALISTLTHTVTRVLQSAIHFAWLFTSPSVIHTFHQTSTQAWILLSSAKIYAKNGWGMNGRKKKMLKKPAAFSTFVRLEVGINSWAISRTQSADERVQQQQRQQLCDMNKSVKWKWQKVVQSKTDGQPCNCKSATIEEFNCKTNQKWWDYELSLIKHTLSSKRFCEGLLITILDYFQHHETLSSSLAQ